MLSDGDKDKIQDILLKSKRKYEFMNTMFGYRTDSGIDYPPHLRHLNDWNIHRFSLYSHNKGIAGYFVAMTMQAHEDNKLWLMTSEDWTGNRIYIPLFDYEEMIS